MTKKTRACFQGNSEIHASWNDLLRAWTTPIIHELGLAENVRFNELKKKLLAISATSLTERLKELEQRGIVQRRMYPEIPPRVEYSLTEKGRELYALVVQLRDWNIRWNRKSPSNYETIKHKKIMSPLKAN